MAGTSASLPSTLDESRSDNGSKGTNNNNSNTVNTADNPVGNVDGKRRSSATNDEAVEAGRGLRKDRDPPLRPLCQLQTPSSAKNGGNQDNQEVAGIASPAPVTSRERSASKDSRVATAQCEFCLRRYLRSAMARHLQACELRLLRCPYQCGVKILVRNLEKHKKVCSLRHVSDVGGGGDAGRSANLSTARAETGSVTETKTTSLRVGRAQGDDGDKAAADDHDDDDHHDATAADDGGDDVDDRASGMAAVTRKPPASGPPPPPQPQSQPQLLPRRRESGNEEGRPSSGGVEAGPVSTSVSGPSGPVNSGDKDRMVTCMRCNESLPFHLVPSHGPKCKAGSGSDPSSQGTKTKTKTPPPPPHKLPSRYQGPSASAVARGPPPPAAAAAAAVTAAAAAATGGGVNPPPPRSRTTPGAGQTARTTSATGGVGQADRTTSASAGATGQREILPVATQGISPVGKTPPPMPTPRYVGAPRGGLPLRSPGSLPPAAVGLKGWNPGPGLGAVSVSVSGRERELLAPRVGVPRSPPRSKAVRFWGTRQVASWLREVMRPPRADIISKFHDGGIDGAALLELTDRDLLHPTDGMGITDADMRRQILEAVDALEQ